MKKCKKCGLNETYTKITFDEKGICNYCNFYEKHKSELHDEAALELKFQEKVERAKEKAKENKAKYDCLVGFSGGKDSTYIIYQLAKKYQMRVLAFTFDNGFSTQYGKDNIANALSKLNVDHITFSMNDEILRKQYSMCTKMMKNFCSVCFHNMHYYSYLFAHQNKIPMIVNGRTIGQILQTADSTDRIEPFETSKNLKDFEHQMFGGLEEKAEKSGKTEYLKEINDIEAVSYFAYHKVSEEETMRFLEENIGWQRPKGVSGHADCFAHAMAEYMSIQKHGHPVRTGELAVLVRMGEMSIEEAEEILEKDRKNFQELSLEEKERFYQRIGV
ncbi:MAG: hypothetical protein IJF03_12425 [Lachnospiraceae bacterium]|nr:hypothetical protein [Lachnospiraceae bacterium]